MDEATTLEDEHEELNEVEEQEVLPELKGLFRRLKAILRGNNKRDQALGQRGASMDVGMIFLARLDLFIEEVMGTPQQSKQRLEFEIRFAEGIRLMYDRALQEQPPANSARARKLFVPSEGGPGPRIG